MNLPKILLVAGLLISAAVLVYVPLHDLQRAQAQSSGGVGVPSTGGKVPADFDTIKTGITATASGSQATSVLLVGTINQLATVASSADGVKLLKCFPPMRQTIVNAGSNTVHVYPTAPDTIDAITSATGTTQGHTAGTDAVKEYICTTNSTSNVGTWFSH